MISQLFISRIIVSISIEGGYKELLLYSKFYPKKKLKK